MKEILIAVLLFVEVIALAISVLNRKKYWAMGLGLLLVFSTLAAVFFLL